MGSSGRICFSSDLHGNLVQYKKLFAAAKLEHTNHVVIGGDLLPKDPPNRTISQQRRFLRHYLAPLILRETFGTRIKTYLIFGNDDFKVNTRILPALARRYRFHVLSLTPCRLDGRKFIGYSFVPLTPFKYKDWEKLDANDTPEPDYREKFSLEGVISRDNRLLPTRFSLFPRKNTIENDFKNKRFENKMVWAIHCPPYNTSLDLVKRNTHVGSIAIRRAILRFKPLISLHGHIHETVDISGRFKEKLGSTWCYSAGNSPHGPLLRYIVVDLDAPGKGMRKAL